MTYYTLLESGTNSYTFCVTTERFVMFGTANISVLDIEIWVLVMSTLGGASSVSTAIDLSH